MLAAELTCRNLGLVEDTVDLLVEKSFFMGMTSYGLLIRLRM